MILLEVPGSEIFFKLSRDLENVKSGSPVQNGTSGHISYTPLIHIKISCMNLEYDIIRQSLPSTLSILTPHN